jgi:serine/threonine-protein kinase
LQQQVAIKLLLPELVAHEQILERFLREARASAALKGEHVCRVSDVGTLDSGAPYIVMELLSGHDLASVIAKDGALPVQTAVDYVLQGLLGLAEAHALRIVHRDLKPANLFLTRRPDGSPLVKVLDFGIAKAQNDERFDLTRTAAVMGSPGYMSPEQLRSTKDADTRSDIWSIGVILFELVVGHPPFQGESITELALHIAMDPTPSLPAKLPAGFDQIVYRCLEKDPALRFADVATLAHALASYGGPKAAELAAGVARVLNVVAVPPSAGVAAASRPTTLQGEVTGGVPGGARSRLAWIGGGVIAAAVVTIALVIALGRNNARSTAEPPAVNAIPGAPPSAASTASQGGTNPALVPDPVRVEVSPDASVPVPDSEVVAKPTAPPPSAPPRDKQVVKRKPPATKRSGSAASKETPATAAQPHKEDLGDSRY